MIFKRLARYGMGLCGVVLWIHTTMAAPAALQPWRQDGACDVKPLTMPAPVARPGCALAWRIALEPGQQLDICQVEEDVGRVKFELSSASEDPSMWELAVMGTTFEANAVRIERARRTEDGQWRTLLAVRTAQTQGMGVSRWSILSLEATSQVSEPVETEDWGVMSFATQLPAAKGCHVLISRWLPGHEPGEGAGRGDGLYVVGRWYQWGRDGFLPHPTRPVVYRRYLRELERLRDDALDAGRPAHWAVSPRTKTVIGPYPLQ
jgi:hypothetical protein